MLHLAGKEEFVRKFSKNSDKKYSIEKSREIYDIFFDTLKNVLVEYGGIKIIGLFSLIIKTRKAKMGTNPATGEKIPIPERKYLKLEIPKQTKDFIKDL